MKIYKNQSEVDADIKDGVLLIKGDVRFEVSFSIEANIVVEEGDINALDINAWDIKAGDINAVDINAGDINAVDIKAGNINAGDINALDINAVDISFYAVAFAYNSFVCKSIVGRRENSKYFCLDKEVEIKKKAMIEEQREFFVDDIIHDIEGFDFNSKEARDIVRNVLIEYGKECEEFGKNKVLAEMKHD